MGSPVFQSRLMSFLSTTGSPLATSTFHSCSQRVPLAAHDTDAPTSPAKSDRS